MNAVLAPLRRYIGPLTETAWVSAGQVVAFAGGIIGIKLLTNVMPPDRYGEFALGISIAGAINMMVFGALSQIVLRFYSVCRERKELDAYAHVLLRLHRSVIGWLLLAGIAFAAAAAALVNLHWALLVLVAIIFGVLSGLQGSATSLMTALRDRKNTAVTQGLDSWLRLGFAVVLVLVMGTQGYWAIIGYILGAAVILCLQFIALCRQDVGNLRAPGDAVAETALRGEFISYGVPFLSFGLLGAVSQYADRWLLQGFSGTDAVGIYAVMFQIASAPIVFLMAVANQLIVPVVFSRYGSLEDRNRAEHGHRLLIHSTLFIGLIYALITLVAYVLGAPLIALLTNASYLRYAEVFWVLVLSLALFHLAQFLITSGLGMNRPEVYLLPKFGQMLSLIVFGVPLVWKWGVSGMAFALLLSSIVFFAWTVLVNVNLWKDRGRADGN